MTSDRMARALVDEAVATLRLIDTTLELRRFARTVRLSQEAVELALKGLLRGVGIEPPRWHDVGEVLLASPEVLPAELRDDAARFAAISKELGQHRQPALYGDEATDRPPDDLFNEAQARRAAVDARFVVERVNAAISRL